MALLTTAKAAAIPDTALPLLGGQGLGGGGSRRRLLVPWEPRWTGGGSAGGRVFQAHGPDEGRRWIVDPNITEWRRKVVSEDLSGLSIPGEAPTNNDPSCQDYTRSSPSHLMLPLVIIQEGKSVFCFSTFHWECRILWGVGGCRLN